MPTNYSAAGGEGEIIYSNATDVALPVSAQRKNNTRYLYFKRIAQGGKCNIQSCRDMHLGRTVCHKTLRKEFEDDPEQQRQFLREARVTAMLQHPNTAPVYEVGSDAHGRYYFTMKLVTGVTLREVFEGLAAGRKEVTADWDLYRLLDAIIQVGQVLSYAHAHGVVHCDVKPENIVIGSFGEVMLLDWGMAWLQAKGESGGDHLDSGDDGDAAPLRSKESHPGTPLYMSPEQMKGDPLDARTDIYSLGAILFEILTGQPLAWGETIDEIIHNKLNNAPLSAIVVAPDRSIPGPLDSLCLRCVQTEPEHRISTMLEFIHEILFWLRMDSAYRPV